LNSGKNKGEDRMTNNENVGQKGKKWEERSRE
jgi:hypothetical protein